MDHGERWFDGDRLSPYTTDSRTQCMTDADEDGYGSDSPASAGISAGTDCDDAVSTTYPGATDAWYDGVDADCDGASDYDQDADGYDSDAYGGTDCDDTDALTHPAAGELEDLDEDGLDWGHDGDTDELDWCTTDADEDGYGDDTSSHDPGTDCDDADDDTYPGADDWVGNGEDESCDGMDGLDSDGDGHASDAFDGDDCDDSEATTYPGAPDTWYDGVDSDCAGDSDYDADADGQDSSDYSGTDCDDADPLTYDGAASQESGCMTDADGDGWGAASPASSDIDSGSDCDDTSDTTYPAAAIYEDLDGDGATVDDGDSHEWGYCTKDDDLDGYGDVDTSTGNDAGTDCDDDDVSTYPAAAELEDLDEDGDSWSDGDIDELGWCTTDVDEDGYGDALSAHDPGTDCDDSDAGYNPGVPDYVDAYGLDLDCDGVDGEDDDGDGQASEASGGEDCDDTDPDIHEGAEDDAGDAVDEDCSGYLNCYADVDDDGHGDPDSTGEDSDSPTASGGVSSTGCGASSTDGWDDDDDDCDDLDDTVHPLATELCDGQDNDCDGSLPSDEDDDDGDGYVECTVDSDGWDGAAISGGDDCDDTVATYNPGAEDVVGDDYDQDCTGLLACYTDADNDRYGTDDGTYEGTGSPSATAGVGSSGACDGAADWDDDAEDCDDSDASINPGESEVVGDDVDDDCSGWLACYPDADDDGFVEEGSTGGEDDGTGTWSYESPGAEYGAGTSTCAETLGWDDDDVDCDDADADTFPGAAEHDSTTACMTDADGDGWGDDSPSSGVDYGSDCDDDADDTFPGSAEVESATDCMTDLNGTASR